MRSALALSALLLLLLLPPSLAKEIVKESSDLNPSSKHEEQPKPTSTVADAGTNAGVVTGADTGDNTGAGIGGNAGVSSDANATRSSADANTGAMDPSMSPGIDAKSSISADADATSAPDTGKAAATPAAGTDTSVGATTAAAAGADTSVGAGADANEAPAPVKGGLVPSPTPSDAGKSDNMSIMGPAPTQSSSASGPDLPIKKATTTSSSSAGPAADPQDSDQAVHMPTPVSKTDTSSSQDVGPNVSIVSATQAGDPETTPPLGVNYTTSTPTIHLASTSLASNDTETPSNVPEDGGQRTAASSEPGPVAGPTSVPSESPSTSTPPGMVSADPFPGQEQNTSQKPNDFENPTPSSKSLSPDIFRPTATASIPEALPSIGTSSDSSARFTSAVPQDVHPSPTPTVPHDRIHCDPPESFSEKMLVLNFTKTGLCDGSPHDEKLSTILCQAAKPTFNPAHDQCHIRLVPILGRQALAIKEITIKTNLLPQDMFQLLGDKWDTLKEAGVSYMELEKQGPPEETEDRFSMPLIITIICMASFLLLVAALYGCCHQRLSQRKDQQQRLTEELQTVENGYHDNPTLEVMETSAEMVEKKVVSLNGELGDSWIVPLDNLTKDDLDEEEDTHL